MNKAKLRAIGLCPTTAKDKVARSVHTQADRIFQDICTGLWESVSCSGGKTITDGWYAKREYTNGKDELVHMYINSSIFSYIDVFDRLTSRISVEGVKRLCRCYKDLAGCMITEDDISYLYKT
jgi:hypothetical protein